MFIKANSSSTTLWSPFSRRRRQKKPLPYGNGKQLYHPFTYPPICAQGYGRAPTLISCQKLHTDAYFQLSQARLGSDIHGNRGIYRSLLPRQTEKETRSHILPSVRTPYRAFTYPDSLHLFRTATVFVTVFRFFTYRFYYKDIKKSILF